MPPDVRLLLVFPAINDRAARWLRQPLTTFVAKGITFVAKGAASCPRRRAVERLCSGSPVIDGREHQQEAHIRWQAYISLSNQNTPAPTDKSTASDTIRPSKPKAKTEHKDINTRARRADALTFEGALFVFERWSATISFL